MNRIRSLLRQLHPAGPAQPADAAQASAPRVDPVRELHAEARTFAPPTRTVRGLSLRAQLQLARTLATAPSQQAVLAEVTRLLHAHPDDPELYFFKIAALTGCGPAGAVPSHAGGGGGATLGELATLVRGVLAFPLKAEQYELLSFFLRALLHEAKGEAREALLVLYERCGHHLRMQHAGTHAAKGMLLHGDTLLHRGATAAALRVFEGVAARFPASADAQCRVGYAHWVNKDGARAYEHYHRAFTLDGTHMDALEFLTKWHDDHERTDEALRFCRAAAEAAARSTHPLMRQREPEFILYTGFLERKRGDHRAALAAFQRARAALHHDAYVCMLVALEHLGFATPEHVRAAASAVQEALRNTAALTPPCRELLGVFAEHAARLPAATAAALPAGLLDAVKRAAAQ